MLSIADLAADLHVRSTGLMTVCFPRSPCRWPSITLEMKECASYVWTATASEPRLLLSVLSVKTRVFSLLLLATFLAVPASASTIANYFTGVTNGSAQTPGQKVTTPAGGPWDDIVFNFYDSSLNPYASGVLYLLTSPYSGTPASLSTSASGFLADASVSNNEWVFDPTVSLNANTVYYFYMSIHPPQGTVISDSGSGAYGSANGTGSFTARPFSMEYTLQGTTANASPEPSCLLLALGGAAMIGLQVRRQQERDARDLSRVALALNERLALVVNLPVRGCAAPAPFAGDHRATEEPRR